MRSKTSSASISDISASISISPKVAANFLLLQSSPFFGLLEQFQNEIALATA
jgi:hypothetical protein